MARNRDEDWAEAKRLCRLSKDELRMARAMGMNPRKLIKNRPSPSQRWKAPVGVWVRELYRKRHGDPPARRPQSFSPPPPPEEPDELEVVETPFHDDSWADSGSSWEEGKLECRVPGCGSALFLRQHEEFVFDPRSLDPARSTLLFDRARALGPPSLGRWEDDDIPF